MFIGFFKFLICFPLPSVQLWFFVLIIAVFLLISKLFFKGFIIKNSPLYYTLRQLVIMSFCFSFVETTGLFFHLGFIFHDLDYFYAQVFLLHYILFSCFESFESLIFLWKILDSFLFIFFEGFDFGFLGYFSYNFLFDADYGIKNIVESKELGPIILAMREWPFSDTPKAWDYIIYSNLYDSVIDLKINTSKFVIDLTSKEEENPEEYFDNMWEISSKYFPGVRFKKWYHFDAQYLISKLHPTNGWYRYSQTTPKMLSYYSRGYFYYDTYYYFQDKWFMYKYGPAHLARKRLCVNNFESAVSDINELLYGIREYSNRKHISTVLDVLDKNRGYIFRFPSMDAIMFESIYHELSVSKRLPPNYDDDGIDLFWDVGTQSFTKHRLWRNLIWSLINQPDPTSLLNTGYQPPRAFLLEVLESLVDEPTHFRRYFTSNYGYYVQEYLARLERHSKKHQLDTWLLNHYVKWDFYQDSDLIKALNDFQLGCAYKKNAHWYTLREQLQHKALLQSSAQDVEIFWNMFLHRCYSKYSFNIFNENAVPVFKCTNNVYAFMRFHGIDMERDGNKQIELPIVGRMPLSVLSVVNSDVLVNVGVKSPYKASRTILNQHLFYHHFFSPACQVVLKSNVK